MSEKTPLESFIDYKAQTGMQCGNYSIDLPELQKGEQYRFHFDASKCIGCRCCEVACNEQNNNPADIKWRRVGEMEAGEFGHVSTLFNSMSCNHCIDPACLIGCPTNSYIKFENGIVYHDDEACIGCQYCTWNCPYSVPTFHEARHIVTKCHMCHERLEQNQSPACVQACPSGAIEIETVNIKTWLEADIDTQGNMEGLVNARVTNATTRYTLPDTTDKSYTKADAHLLKPAHSEWPLVFMTLLTQISLGAFIAVFLGELLFSFNLSPLEPDFMMYGLALMPAALGLPLSALHLGRPIKALSAFKNIKSSWLSREGLALALYALGLTLLTLLSFFERTQALLISVGVLVLLLGLFGIHAQAMIYRIKARPSWDRITTNSKFFGTTYLGFGLLAVYMALSAHYEALGTILTVSMLLALSQLFFSLEDLKQLKAYANHEYTDSMKRSFTLLNRFARIKGLRFSFLILFGLLSPLFALISLEHNQTVATLLILLSFIGGFLAELCDRWLFYVTASPLSMPGSFFVGDQRGGH